MLESEGMARTIGVVTVARSDYGHLVPLLEALRDTPGITLQLYVAGAHLSPRFGETVSAIEADGWPVSARVETTGASDAAVEVAAGTGAGVVGFARAFAAGRPDLVVLLGDRAEMLAAAVAALPLAIPVAHLHGGEVTEGAIDEQRGGCTAWARPGSISSRGAPRCPARSSRGGSGCRCAGRPCS